jgi:hypothetical protein
MDAARRLADAIDRAIVTAHCRTVAHRRQESKSGSEIGCPGPRSLVSSCRRGWIRAGGGHWRGQPAGYPLGRTTSLAQRTVIFHWITSFPIEPTRFDRIASSGPLTSRLPVVPRTARPYIPIVAASKGRGNGNSGRISARARPAGGAGSPWVAHPLRSLPAAAILAFFGAMAGFWASRRREPSGRLSHPGAYAPGSPALRHPKGHDIR